MNVGIYLFDEVEVLDFAGPFEVFSLAAKDQNKLCQVTTVGATGEMISARNGLKVTPTCSFDNHAEFDILIIPGGYGAREIEIHQEPVLNWIRGQKEKVRIMASVCTGSILLAECGILDGRRATTHWMHLDRLEREYPKVRVIRDRKFVDDQDVVTSAGISAGIDMSFHLLARIFDQETAQATARRMEYDPITHSTHGAEN
jgi:transcriptional regulator GlxA family with amidase domain